jgi:predicted metalloendopeptidase
MWCSAISAHWDTEESEMANEIGTASNLEDLFTKIVTFLTTNSALITADQEWEVLRIRRDNLAAVTTNMVEPTALDDRRTWHTFRYDARSLNTDDEVSSARDNYFSSTATLGTSHVTAQLRVAKEVKTVRLRAPTLSGALVQTLRDFKLQYSDNGTSWTTALTQTGTAIFGLGEWRDYAVPGTPGAHL